MEEGFTRIKGRVPFTIKEIHPDNGPEFFNNHMVRFWGEELTGLRLSRSRPYHKNDNRWVEQKNDTLVRAYLGNGRLDTQDPRAGSSPQRVVRPNVANVANVGLLHYYNLFQPVLHLSEKRYAQEEGKMRRKWDQARTPYVRLKQAGAGMLSQEEQERLDLLYIQVHTDKSSTATH